MAITIVPVGGLGNQLFIWAAGFAMARAKGVSLVADSASYSESTERLWELDSFDSGIESTSRSSKWARGLMNRLHHLPGTTRWLVTDRSRIPLNPSHVSPHARLRGYFQDCSYFLSTTSEIRARVRAITQPTSWFLDTSARLEEMGAFIGIHIRRGDYVRLPQHGVLPNHYYQQALASIWREASIDIPIIVTTDGRDSLPWLPGLAPEAKIELLRPPPESRPIESLILLSKSRYLIAANSTFSWWAGLVANSAAVHYPAPWFRQPNLLWPGPPDDTWRPIASGFSLQ